MSKPLTAIDTLRHNPPLHTHTVLHHIHRSSCHSLKLICQCCLTVCVCVKGVPFPLSHFMATRLLTQIWLWATCHSDSVILSSLYSSLSPVPCPPVIPDLPLLTYVTRPHPRACGLKARIDRHCFMMTAAHGLCEKGGGKGGEGERQRAKDGPNE